MCCLGFTAIHLAAVHKELLATILSHGANVNAKSKSSGDTALHIAATVGKTDCVRLCLAYGADISATNNLGVTPFDVVKRGGNWLGKLFGRADAAYYMQLVQTTQSERAPEEQAPERAPVRAQERASTRCHSDRTKSVSSRSSHRSQKSERRETTSTVVKSHESNYSIELHELESEQEVDDLGHDAKYPLLERDKSRGVSFRHSSCCQDPTKLPPPTPRVTPASPIYDEVLYPDDPEEMEAPCIRQPVESLLECGICLGMMNNPVTLPCGHNFCMGCIEELIRHVDPKKSDRPMFACPLDRLRMPCSIQLRTSVTLQHIADLYRNKHEQ